jgi:hypothetical protein
MLFVGVISFAAAAIISFELKYNCLKLWTFLVQTLAYQGFEAEVNISNKISTSKKTTHFHFNHQLVNTV